MNSRPVGPAAKIHALTSLRFFAAFWVVLYHSLRWYRHQDTFFSNTIEAGAASVSFFFFLSGYILSVVYLRNRDTINRSKFYAARFARIYPLFLATLLLDVPFLLMERVHKYGVVQAIEKTSATLLANLVMLQAWILRLRGLDDPNWSLAVETIFYILFPFVGFWLWRRSRGQALILGFVVWVASQILVLAATAHFSRDVALLTPILHVPTFVLGILFARLYLESESASGARSEGRAFVLSSLGVATGVVALIIFYHRIPETLLRDGVLVPIYCALIALFSLDSFWPARLVSHPWLVVLGEASYGLYLIHLVVLHLWEALHLETHAWLYPIYLSICIGLSVLSFYYFEAPARRFLLNRFHTRSRETLETASDAQ